MLIDCDGLREIRNWISGICGHSMTRSTTRFDPFLPSLFFSFFFSFIDAPIQRGFSSFSLLLFFYRLDRLKLKVTCSNLTKKIFKRCIFFFFFFLWCNSEEGSNSRARALKARNWPRREENDSNSLSYRLSAHQCGFNNIPRWRIHYFIISTLFPAQPPMNIIADLLSSLLNNFVEELGKKFTDLAWMNHDKNLEILELLRGYKFSKKRKKIL